MSCSERKGDKDSTAQMIKAAGRRRALLLRAAWLTPGLSLPALEVLCVCRREEANCKMCAKPPEEEQRKPRCAGLDKTRKREARCLPSAYFEEITINPNFQKHLTICTSKHPSFCLSVLQAFYPPSSLSSVHLIVIPQPNSCQRRQGGVGQATRYGIGTRHQKMRNPLC